MDGAVTYKGRLVTVEDIDFINQLIEKNPDDSRRALSKKLCAAWNWVQPNGTFQDMVCRSFMLHLHRAGYIHLPPKKCTPNNPLANRKKPIKIAIDQAPIVTKLSTIQPLEIQQVRQSPSEPLFNSLIEHYHYLGYCHPIGEHLKYLVFVEDRPVAGLSWSSAVRHIKCRDKFIGWSKATRERNLSFIVYGCRFLILPWVRVPSLASHLLGKMAKVLQKDWQRIYHHRIYFLETFVDKERLEGTCYRAANWIYLGDTTGRGKNDQTHKVNRSIKAVWGYPLCKDFRDQLCRGMP